MPDIEPNEELAGLLKAVSEDRLSPEQHARLDAILRDDPQARKHYLRYVNTDAVLAWRYAPVPDLPVGLDLGNEAPQSIVALPNLRRGTETRLVWRHALNVAAILMLGLCLGLPLGWRLNSSLSDERRPSSEFVASLVSVTNDVVWSKLHSMPRTPGSELGKGWMQIDAGTIELRFRSGATVRVEGPAAFGLDSAMRGFLEYGRATVHAPENARDFVVGTATMEVVDLGTQFTMSVEEKSGKSTVKVLEGRVDLHIHGEGAQPRIQPLTAGRSANVDAAGQVITIEGNALDPQNQLNSDLLAHWPLDVVDAAGKVADASGNGLDGKLQGNMDAVVSPGKAGRAFDLTRGGYIDISAHSHAIAKNPAFTIAAWVRDAGNIVFSVSDGTPRDRVEFELHSNLLLYGWQQGGRFDHISAGVAGWERGRWYHVAVSVSGGLVTLYRDGRALSSRRSRGMKIDTPSRGLIDIAKPTHAYIGYLIANHVNAPQSLHGMVDDVQIYGRALDERAIRDLYEHPGETYRDTSQQP